MSIHPKNISKYCILIILLVLVCYAKTYSQQVTYSYETPFVPIVLSYNSADGLSITASAGVNTFIGRFSTNYTQTISKKRAVLETMNVGNTTIKKQDLIIVVRNMKRLHREDDIYIIRDGAYYSYKTEGNVNTEVKEGEIIIGIVDDTGSFKLTLYDGATRIETTQKSNTTTYNIKEVPYKTGYYKVVSDKTFFHKNEWYTMNGSRTQKYITKGNIVYIEKISRTGLTGYTVFTYNGQTIKGWLIMKHLQIQE